MRAEQSREWSTFEVERRTKKTFTSLRNDALLSQSQIRLSSYLYLDSSITLPHYRRPDTVATGLGDDSGENGTGTEVVKSTKPTNLNTYPIAINRNRNSRC